ncbi:MAG: hypothetical protein AAF250_06660 [Pseudomonadota bacterium]
MANLAAGIGGAACISQFGFSNAAYSAVPKRGSGNAIDGLDREQLGHLRHVKNLADAPDGDWSYMGAIDTEQAYLSAYRYQLAYMAYTLGITHYHHLPAAPGVFKAAYQNVMRKMMRYDVWSYWFDTSRSGPRLDPSLASPREPWRDPVVKENIMYSGHLLAMSGLYAVLFDDDRYAEDGGLTLRHQPMFWGSEPFVYEYDFTSLKQAIFVQMLQNGWLGVACEPNNVFVVCNQFPMLGFRFHDLRHGSQDAEMAERSYLAAWERAGGLLTDGGDIFATYMVKQQAKVGSGGLDWNAWSGAVLNAWTPETARALYAQQAPRYFGRTPDGRTTIYQPTVLEEVQNRRNAGEANPSLHDPEFNWRAPTLGYSAIWMAELGDRERLEGLLAHADRHMNPSWVNGGLYYPRNDASYNTDGEMVFMEPLSGNAMLAYARLNPAGGLNQLYRRPWTSDHFEEPVLANDPVGVNVSKAYYDRNEGELVLNIEAVANRPKDTQLKVRRGPGRRWTIRRDGELVAERGLTGVSSSGTISAMPVYENGIVIDLTIENPSEIRIRWA